MAHCAYRYLEPDNSSNVLLSAEHAGAEVPPHLDGLGIERSELLRHIGWDIGIEGVIHRLHQLTGLPAMLGRYSRLVVDLNRPTDSPECIIEDSDGTHIPGNTGLSPSARQARIDRFHQPFHAAFAELVQQLQPRYIISVHSFTPMLRTEGFRRPWHCGILYGSADELARRCLSHLSARPGLVVGENQPYRIETDHDYTIPIHGDSRRIPTVIVEIRQDLIDDSNGQEYWAGILRGMIEACCSG